MKITIPIVFISIWFSFALMAQESKVLISEGFAQGTLPAGWSASKGFQINLPSNITTDDSAWSLPGTYGIGLNTQGYFLQLPEITSCGLLKFSIRGSQSPSNLGFKVQKMISGNTVWEDIATFKKPISGNKENTTVTVNEAKRTKLRILLHDRTANTLYLDNITATSFIDSNQLNLNIDIKAIDFGNCINDSTIYISFIEPHDSIGWVDLSVQNEGFNVPSNVNVQETVNVPITFNGTQYRNYESALEIKLGNQTKTIPLRARRVSGNRMTLLTDLTFGEGHPNWIVKAVEHAGYFLLDSTDSLSIPFINLSDCKALQILANLRTYNGTNQQLLSIEGRNKHGEWVILDRIKPLSASLKMYESLILLEDDNLNAIRFTAKNLSGSLKIGVESITINGAFGSALSVPQTTHIPVQVSKDSNNVVTISSETSLNTVLIFDLNGKIILQKEIPSNSFRVKLPKGIYLINLMNRVVKMTI